MEKVPVHYLSARRTGSQRAFLEAYRTCGNISFAASQVGIHRKQHYRWTQADPEYAAAWREAQEDAADHLEKEAWRRAVEGVPEPVYQQGRQVGEVRRFSDHLLMFLLKGVRPEKFRDTFKAELKVDNERAADPELDNLSDEDIQTLYAISIRANQSKQARAAIEPPKPQ